MLDIVLKNCTIVNENKIFESDIGIKGGRIEKIVASISDEAKQTLDLSGKVVIPGVIDDQVHFREPGLTDRKSTRLNSSHSQQSRMPSSA